MSDISIQPINARQDKRLYLKYINKFRAGYFADAPSMSILDVNHAIEQKIVMGLILLNNKCVGIVEATPGNIYSQKILNIATIYVDTRHRGQGIANVVYKYFSNLQDDIDVALQIEESNYTKNASKFKDMGFTHYAMVECVSSSDHRKYDEKTYVLYDKKHDDICKELD